jgi:hypothetical protein
MKLVGTLSLQEPCNTQFSLHFTTLFKNIMKRMGWNKRSTIAIYAHNHGFYIERVELETPKPVKARTIRAST